MRTKRGKQSRDSGPVPAKNTAASRSRDRLAEFIAFLKRWKSLLVAVAAVVTAWIALRQLLDELPGWVAPALAIGAGGLILTLDTLPRWKDRLRRDRLRHLQLNIVPGYFRLEPRSDVADRPEEFSRSDGVHAKVESWVHQSQAQLLYLTGHSGCGKSSIVNAHLHHCLPRKGIQVVIVRTFASPVLDIRRELVGSNGFWKNPPDLSESRPRAMLERAAARVVGNRERLLLVLDQFEELFILCDRDAPHLAEIRDLLSSHVSSPIPGLTILLVCRSEFIEQLLSLGFPRLDSGTTWRDVPPFTLPAGQAFLELGRIPSSDAEGLVTQASQIDAIPGQVRPVTLNLLGLIYERDPPTGTKLSHNDAMGKGLLLHYLKARIQSGDLKNVAGQLLRRMITPSGFRRPPAKPEELAEGSDSQVASIHGALLRLKQEGLVRSIGGEVWEVSHDFLATQLNLVLQRLEQSIARVLMRWAAVLAVVTWCGLVTIAAWSTNRNYAKHEAEKVLQEVLRVKEEPAEPSEEVTRLQSLIRQIDEARGMARLAQDPELLKKLDAIRAELVSELEKPIQFANYRFVNEFSEEITVVFQDRSFRVLPGQERLIRTRPGQVTYQVLQLQRTPQVRSISPGETKTVRIYPLSD
jgi:energy-coupling factor transporter ATP-binding protein EcfA2